jgi:hypothetical protein
MIRRCLTIVAIGVLALAASAHVGDGNVYYAGDAGPYPVQVSIRLPGVVPGLAEIAVQVNAEGARQVTVQPVFWETSTGGAPPPDEAALVAGETRLYAARLWLMTPGSYSVRVHVSGERGGGELFIPVNNVATRRLAMQRPLGIALLGLGAFLAIGLLTIVGAAVREGMLPPGEEPDARRRRRSWIVRGAWVVGITLALSGGKAWWASVDAAYRRNLYKPLEVRTTVAPSADGRMLTVAIVDSGFLAGQFTPIVPDHGKLMHLFLAREDGGAFAHLHPVRRDSAFIAELPPIPPGRYRVYADIVHASGFAQTLTDTVDVGGDATAGATGDDWRAADADASWSATPPSPAAVTPVPGGTITWERPATITAGADASLRFMARDSSGAPMPLEPYMGMLAHAAVTRSDGGVFVHLHPMGTISMAAQRQFERRSRGDTALAPVSSTDAPMAHEGHDGSGAVTFPYVFPGPGRYHLWVQVKRGDQVLTGAFDADVRAP